MSATDDKPCLLTAEVSGTVLLREKLGAAETQHAVLRCLHRMERVATGFKGQVQDAVGAARLTALFDSAEVAHLASREMQQRVLDLPPVSGVKLAINVSFHPVAAVGDKATPIAFLSLRHGDTELFLGPEKTQAVLGRDSHNDIVISDPRASRIHARIEWRRDNYVLSDQSRNGTFVGLAGSPEIALMRAEVVLRGRGYISCGCSHGPETDEVVEFDCSALEGQ